MISLGSTQFVNIPLAINRINYFMLINLYYSIPGFGESDEANAAEKLLECFDGCDVDGMKTCTSQPLFTYLDNEV